MQHLLLELLNFLTVPDEQIITRIPLYLFFFWFTGGRKLQI